MDRGNGGGVACVLSAFAGLYKVVLEGWLLGREWGERRPRWEGCGAGAGIRAEPGQDPRGLSFKARWRGLVRPRSVRLELATSGSGAGPVLA